MLLAKEVQSIKNKIKKLCVQYALLNNDVKTAPSIFNDVLLVKCRNLKVCSFTCTTVSTMGILPKYSQK